MSKLKLAFVASLLLASSAWADEKYGKDRNAGLKVDVHLSDKVKPIQTKPQDKSEFKPELTADAVLSIEGLVSNIRNEQEQILAQLIDQTPDTEVEEKSDYYFRLGELYAKQQRLFRLKAAELSIQVDKAKTPQAKAQAQAQANKAAETAKQYLLKAVKTYKGLTDNDAFRNYPKMDMALFYYGYTLQGGKYMKEARAVYDKLLKNYPNSKYVPEAHLAFADYYFEQGQLADAEARYKMVLKFPKSSAYWYAMYKMGWIHLNLQRFQEALETFFQVANATKNDKKQEVLNRAAKKDFVRAYAEIGKADQAFNAFKRVDANYAMDMLQILADLYLEQGKSDKAIYTYRDLMKRAPTNKNVCLWQYNVAHAMLSMPGASALGDFPVESLRPALDATRSVSSHAVARPTQRIASGCTRQASKVEVGRQVGAASSDGPSSPAASPVSSRTVATSSLTSPIFAATFSSRTPSPPVRRTAGGVAPHASRIVVSRRTASAASPAAAESTLAVLSGSLVRVTVRASSLPRLSKRRRATPTSAGSCTVVPPSGASRPRAISRSAGGRLSSTVSVGLPGRRCGGFRTVPTGWARSARRTSSSSSGRLDSTCCSTSGA